MRLIDADAAIEVVHKWLENVFGISSTADEVTVFKRLRALPTVDAVPLDKLCEFLVKCGADSYCGTCKQIMGECFTNGGHGCGSEHFWKELLTKWMEGLDETV